MQFSALFYRLYHGQFPAEYRVLSSEAQVPVLDQAVYSESSSPATPPESQLRQGWSYSILSWETKGGKSLLPSPCIIGPQEGQSPLLDTCKKHYFPEITGTRSGPTLSSVLCKFDRQTSGAFLGTLESPSIQTNATFENWFIGLVWECGLRSTPFWCGIEVKEAQKNGFQVVSPSSDS